MDLYYVYKVKKKRERIFFNLNLNVCKRNCVKKNLRFVSVDVFNNFFHISERKIWKKKIKFVFSLHFFQKM